MKPALWRDSLMVIVAAVALTGCAEPRYYIMRKVPAIIVASDPSHPYPADLVDQRVVCPEVDPEVLESYPAVERPRRARTSAGTSISCNLMVVQLPGIEEDVTEQTGSDTCWAAGVQSILKYYSRVDVPQSKIIHSERPEAGASHEGTIDNIEAALVANVEDSSQAPTVSDVADMVDDLLEGVPDLLLMKRPGSPVGHIYVLGGAKYSVGSKVRTIYYEVYVFDPTPGAGWRWMSGAELQRGLLYIVRIK
jgi:hypothetical protein